MMLDAHLFSLPKVSQARLELAASGLVGGQPSFFLLNDFIIYFLFFFFSFLLLY
jgi:hypothetical protein